MLPDAHPAPGAPDGGVWCRATAVDGPGGCHDRTMAATSAELSSLATALDELTRRVTVHA